MMKVNVLFHTMNLLMSRIKYILDDLEIEEDKDVAESRKSREQERNAGYHLDHWPANWLLWAHGFCNCNLKFITETKASFNRSQIGPTHLLYGQACFFVLNVENLAKATFPNKDLLLKYKICKPWVEALAIPWNTGFLCALDWPMREYFALLRHSLVILLWLSCSSLCTLDWPWTCGTPCVSVSQRLGLFAHTIIPCSELVFWRSRHV